MAKDFECWSCSLRPPVSRGRQIAGMMKDANPKLKVAFVGPPVTMEPERALKATSAIDFVVQTGVRSPDRRLTPKASLSKNCPASASARTAKNVHNPEGRAHRESRRTPLGTKDLQARSRLSPLQRSVPAESVPFVLHSPGLPGDVHLLPLAADALRPPWRLRSMTNRQRMPVRQENFPGLKEIFFDDDTFNYQKARTIELCDKLKPLNFTWSCTSRVTTDLRHTESHEGSRLPALIVGYESRRSSRSSKISRRAQRSMARRFTANCKKLGLVVHGDFIVGLPGESRESIRKTIDFAKQLDCETIQVSIAHPYPGTEFYDYARRTG